MRILYYDWDEFNGEDCRDAMRRLGHQVDLVRLNMKGFDVTPEIENTLKNYFETFQQNLISNQDQFQIYKYN